MPRVSTAVSEAFAAAAKAEGRSLAAQARRVCEAWAARFVESEPVVADRLDESIETMRVAAARDRGEKP